MIKEKKKKPIILCWNDACKYNYEDSDVGTRTCSQETIVIDCLGGCMETNVSLAKWKKVLDKYE